MVAQKERDASAGFLRLVLQLVDQPEDLGRVFAPVKNVTDDDQMIPAEAPMQVLVNHSVAAQQADDAILIDSSNMTIEESIDAIVSRVQVEA